MIVQIRIGSHETLEVRLPYDSEHLKAIAEQGQFHVDESLSQRAIHELLGPGEVKTTQIYTHVLNQGPFDVKGPANSFRAPEPDKEEMGRPPAFISWV